MNYISLKKLMKILSAFVVVFLCCGFLGTLTIYAKATGTDTDPATTVSILPEATEPDECMNTYNPDIQGSEKVKGGLNAGDSKTIANWLGCGIKTGNIKLYMVPYYVRSILEFIIGISGLICVGAIIFGGYWYLFAGISEDKEKGKKAILHGIIGMILTLAAWAIVNILISLFTL